MECTSCGAPLRPTERFCGKCGTPATAGHDERPPGGLQIGSDTWTCNACGAETQADKRFCQVCGTPEPPARTATPVVAPHIEAETLRTTPPVGSPMCAHCGTPLTAGSQFCNVCGAPVTWADDRLSCAACGQALPQGAAFCNVCGAAAPQSPPAPPTEAPSASGDGRSHTRLYVLIAAVVCAVAAVVVAGVFFLPDLLDPGPEPPTLTEQTAKVMPAVVQANTDFRTAIRDLRPNGPNIISQTRQRLRVCNQKGLVLRKALQTASTTLSAAPVEGAEPETPAETAAKQALLDAFKANKAFVQSIRSLPADPLRLTRSMVSQCRAAAQDTARAYDDAVTKFAALQPPYQLPAVALTGNATSRLKLTAARMGKERDFIAYLGDVNEVMGGAGSGRASAWEAIDGTQDDCRIEPNEALTLMESAIASRQSSLSNAQSLDAPADDRAKDIQRSLVEAFTLSLRADEQYLLWIQDVADYYYMPEEGLAGQDPTKDFKYYDQAESLNGAADIAKGSLCTVLNGWNEKYGIDDNWSSGDF